MMTQSPLTRCPNCASTLFMGNVVGTAPVDDDWLAVGFVCSTCHVASHLKVGQADWRKILGRDSVQVSPKPRDVPPQDGGSTVDIGRIVAAFRMVDLPSVSSVEDLELLWDYQRKVDPKSIPLEV